MLHLDAILDIQSFQKMQDNIAKAIDMAIVTVDFKGVPVTQHSGCTSFCKKMRDLTQGKDLCQKCDSRGGLEAARIHRPYIYICHQGLIDLAVPILFEGQYLGAMMAGQVRLKKEAKPQKLEVIVHDDFSFENEEEKQNLPEMSYEKIMAIGDMLYEICQLVVEKALIKKACQAPDEEIEKPKKTKANIRGTFTEISEPVDPKLESFQPYPFLEPAFQLLAECVEEKFTVEYMAEKCNISEGYFSKCFQKATGMRFSAYQNQLKIQASEKLLKTTHQSISEISDNLNFESPSYFIRIFKKLLGVTPSHYRKSYLEKMKVEYFK